MSLAETNENVIARLQDARRDGHRWTGIFLAKAKRGKFGEAAKAEALEWLRMMGYWPKNQARHDHGRRIW